MIEEDKLIVVDLIQNIELGQNAQGKIETVKKALKLVDCKNNSPAGVYNDT